MVGGGLAGWLLQVLKRTHHAEQSSTQGLGWLTGTTLCMLIAISMSPNKDVRYIAPLLPLLSLILARGWLILMSLGQKQSLKAISTFILILASLISTVELVRIQWSDIQREPGSPAADVIASLRELSGNDHITVLMAASKRDFNQHTLSYLGKIDGGSIKARRLGRSKGQSTLARDQGHWWLLATGDQAHRENQLNNSAKRCDRSPV